MGADALSLINTVVGLAIDLTRREPKIGFTTGGLSGPAIRPIALRMVWEVRTALPKIPIFGMGGIETVENVVEFLVAGANAVQIGTMTRNHFTGKRRSLGLNLVDSSNVRAIGLMEGGVIV